jgi:hypothetical protein
MNQKSEQARHVRKVIPVLRSVLLALFQVRSLMGLLWLSYLVSFCRVFLKNLFFTIFIGLLISCTSNHGERTQISRRRAHLMRLGTWHQL